MILLDSKVLYVSGKDGFCIVVGLIENGEALTALVYFPARQEFYFIKDGNVYCEAAGQARSFVVFENVIWNSEVELGYFASWQKNCRWYNKNKGRDIPRSLLSLYNMPNNKKGLLIFIIVIVVIALGAAGYYFLVMKAAKPVVWDGTYKMAGDLTCKGNFPGLTTVPMNSTFVVSNNNIMEPTVGKIYPIDKKGQAIEVFQQTVNGATTEVRADYQFSKEGDVYKFTANGSITLSATKDGQALSSICTGTITGDRQP